jgi:hypothetical protein
MNQRFENKLTKTKEENKDELTAKKDDRYVQNYKNSLSSLVPLHK